ncbi:MAG: hypothetical protein L0L05_12560 [Yaniella sp.]|nr:hypothetical protein [Yaniella sp.]
MSLNHTSAGPKSAIDDPANWRQNSRLVDPTDTHIHPIWLSVDMLVLATIRKQPSVNTGTRHSLVIEQPGGIGGGDDRVDRLSRDATGQRFVGVKGLRIGGEALTSL